MQQDDPNSTDLFEDNLVDTFYGSPDDMEDVCLYDFGADYVKSGVDKNESGKHAYIKSCKAVHENHGQSIRRVVVI